MLFPQGTLNNKTAKPLLSCSLLVTGLQYLLTQCNMKKHHEIIAGSDQQTKDQSSYYSLHPQYVALIFQNSSSNLVQISFHSSLLPFKGLAQISVLKLYAVYRVAPFSSSSTCMTDNVFVKKALFYF